MRQALELLLLMEPFIFTPLETIKSSSTEQLITDERSFENAKNAHRPRCRRSLRSVAERFAR
jgi:hypothetical protein